MASGKEHDFSIQVLTVPLGVICFIVFDLRSAISLGLAFLIGGLWLSPDLDVISKPAKRWGLLGILWFPYRKLIPHRSWISHAPIIGTLIRLVYLCTLLTLIIQFFPQQIIGIHLRINIKEVLELKDLYYKDAIFCLAGLEMSALVHIILDKFPVFKKR